MLCVGWRLGVDFVMVGRLEGKEVGAFGALNIEKPRPNKT